MEVLNAGQKVYSFADRHGKKINELISMPDFGSSVVDGATLNYEMTMMGIYWQMAGNLVKEMTEPLKSIVNK